MEKKYLQEYSIGELPLYLLFSVLEVELDHSALEFTTRS